VSSQRSVPLLHVPGSEIAVDREQPLPDTGIGRQRDRLHVGTRCEREGRCDVVEGPLRHGLEEWKHWRRERRRDACHLNPDQPVADARDGLVGDTSNHSQPRAEVQLVQLAGGPRLAIAAEKLELLRLQIEDGCLVVLLRGREVQRVPDAGIERQAIGHPPVVLEEVLLKVTLNSWIASTFGKKATCPGSGCNTETAVGSHGARANGAHRGRASPCPGN
jgi:hypothetical protein